jgi:cytochrome bd ubiquinol oxidase subunit II
MDSNLLFSLPVMQHIWFSAFVILLLGYAILDGFDLGVGMLHMFSKQDEERRLMLNSIGPVWDGNEVWLVTAGGALFAGFPIVYATFCSAFYAPVMILLTGIIFRAVAIEFRSKAPMAWWRWMWDFFFSFASFIIAFVLGIALGNLIRGIPLDDQGEFIGTLKDLLNPYSLLTGFFVVSLFLMHGAIYLTMKTEGILHDRVREWVFSSMIGFIVMYAITTVTTLIYMPHMTINIQNRPIFFLLAVINIFAIANITRLISKGRDSTAFFFSIVNIMCLMGLYAVGTYPIAIRAINDPQNLSLTIFNSSSTNLTLHILLLMACIGIPMVIGYTTAVYYIFRGKVRISEHSY